MKVAQCFKGPRALNTLYCVTVLLHDSLLNTTEQAKQAQRTDHSELRRNMLTHQEDVSRGNYYLGSLNGKLLI